jgi:hypothetical protein
MPVDRSRHQKLDFRHTAVKRSMRRAPTGAEIKAASGLTFAATGVLTLAGLDKAVETVLIAASPQRLTNLMTWF